MNISDMTVPQLREIAADLEIFGRSKMKKADLIAAIEYAEAPSADNIPGGIDDHATSVAKMYANIAAEDEARAAARRARNRTNYAPAIEAVEQVDAEAGELLDDALGERTDSSVTVIVDRYTEGRASVKMQGHAFGDMTREAYRIGRKWELVDQEHGIVFFTIRAGSLQKAVKAWAKKLNTHAERIDVARSF